MPRSQDLAIFLDNNSNDNDDNDDNDTTNYFTSCTCARGN